MIKRILPIWILFAVVSVCLSGLAGTKVSAQTDQGGWSQPFILFEGNGSIDAPVVTADPSGLVHIAWRYTEQPESETGQGRNMELLYYTQWKAGAWTTPVDIVAAAAARAPSLTVDAQGFLHLLWHGDGGLLKYSSARAGEAVSANAWTRPLDVEVTNIHGQILADGSGKIYMVYPGLGNSGPYLQYSTDNGQNWSFPVLISRASRADASVDYVRVAVSETGVIHVVWTEFQLPGGWPPLGVFYARSTDGGSSWSLPVEIAGDGYDQINVTTVGENEIHVAWNGMVGVGGRYHRWSTNGGITWSNVDTITQEGGTEGAPQLVVDSAGTVHLLTTYNACAWYSSWNENRWNDLECIASPEARASNYIEQPALAVSEGNRLHAVFWDNRQRLWYTTKQTNAPFVAPAPFPTEATMITATPTSAMSEVQQATPIPADSPILTSERESVENTNPGRSIALGIIPAVVILVGFLAVQVVLKKRK
jgi:hypothetical protein